MSDPNVKLPAISKPRKLGNTFEIDLRSIVSNKENHRRSAPNLIAEGWGLYERQPGSDMQAVIPELAASDEPVKRAEFVELIRLLQPDLVSMAESMKIESIGQIQPVCVRFVDPENEKAGYDLVDGCRRALARWFLYCESEGVIPPTIKAAVEEKDDVAARMTSAAANVFVEKASPADEARFYKQLVEAGYSPKDIQQATGVDYQTVENRLVLNHLPEKELARLEIGEITLGAAQAKAHAIKDGTDSGEAARPKKKTKVKVTLAALRFDYLHEPRDDKGGKVVDRSLITEEVRQYIAALCGFKYLPVPDARKKEKLAETPPDKLKKKRKRKTKEEKVAAEKANPKPAKKGRTGRKKKGETVDAQKVDPTPLHDQPAPLFDNNQQTQQ